MKGNVRTSRQSGTYLNSHNTSRFQSVFHPQHEAFNCRSFQAAPSRVLPPSALPTSRGIRCKTSRPLFVVQLFEWMTRPIEWLSQATAERRNAQNEIDIDSASGCGSLRIYWKGDRWWQPWWLSGLDRTRIHRSRLRNVARSPS